MLGHSPEILTSTRAEASDTCDWWPPQWEGERWTDSFYQDWGLTRLKCSCTTPPPPFLASLLATSASPLHPLSVTLSDGWEFFPYVLHWLLISTPCLRWLGTAVGDFNQSLSNWFAWAKKCARQISVERLNTICTKLDGEKKSMTCWIINHKSLSTALYSSPQLSAIKPWKNMRTEKGKFSLFSLTKCWLKEKRQSLSFTGVQLPHCQVAEWEISVEVLKRRLSKKDLHLFFRWLSNDWMWLTQIISLITAQQA